VAVRAVVLVPVVMVVRVAVGLVARVLSPMRRQRRRLP
jgi:hypothetical protein